MSTWTAEHGPTRRDQLGRATSGILVATAVLAVAELALALTLAIANWIAWLGMTASERDDSWIEIAFLIAGMIAVPPIVAAILGGPAWAFRRNAFGLALAIGGLVVVGLPALLLMGGHFSWF